MTDAKRWYVGAMNDALFIVNRPPRPSNDDVWPDRPDGPTVILPTHPLTHSEVNGIVDAHNEAVNHLPDYLAAVEALERLTALTDGWDDAIQGSLWMEHIEEARAALARLRARLRDEVPA